jgi:hypothetical protein
MQSPALLQAFYDLMARPEATHASLLAPHRKQTVAAMRRHVGDLLVIHDTTELDYSKRRSLKKIGPIGGGYNRGYLCHNSLVVEPGTRRVLGLINQILATRPSTAKPGVRKVNPKSKSHGLKRRRESRLWVAGAAAVPEHACLTGSRWIDVCDRGADTFEFLQSEQRRKRHFVIRSSSNRLIFSTPDATTADAKLHTWIRQQPACGQTSLQVPARKGRPARTAQLHYSFAETRLAPPRQQRGHYKREPQQVWIVRVWEPQPPKGQKATEWILITNVPVRSPENALRALDWYATRWVIEEYHKCLKTGMGMENLQLRSEDRLEPALAVLSVTALTLLNLRAAAAEPNANTRPAREVIDPLFVAVLACWRYPGKPSSDLPSSDLTVQEFLLALARLGGHQNRRRDGLPGWQTLWRGWNQLHAMAAYERARKQQKSD